MSEQKVLIGILCILAVGMLVEVYAAALLVRKVFSDGPQPPYVVYTHFYYQEGCVATVAGEGIVLGGPYRRCVVWSDGRREWYE